ncbi:MAG: zinc metalloprotease HtpX [Thermaurantiacus sp.]
MNQVKTFMLMAAMVALFMGFGFLLGGQQGALIAFLIAAAMNVFAYWNSDKLVLKMHNAKEVGEDHPLHRMVAELAKRAELPMPKVYIVEQQQPNAFATGRNPNNAAVAATSGLLQLLDRDEIAGVMAHELAHIKNRDTLVMTITATLAGAISMLANFFWLFSANRSQGGGPGPITAILAMIVAPIAAALVQMAISRTREYGADAVGAEISGKPDALANALAKLSSSAKRIPNPVAERNPAAASLYIVKPFGGGAKDNLFSTHPNPENRIAALQAIAESMGPLPGAIGAAEPWSQQRRVSALDPNRRG